MSVIEILNHMFPDNPFAWLFAVLVINIMVLCLLRKRK